MIDLTSKLEEINDIEHNKGSKTYPQNQVILDLVLQISRLSEGSTGQIFATSRVIYQMKMWGL